MKKFHYNSAGEPGVCSAKPGNCPFGFSENEHFDSESDARKSFESLHSNSNVNTLQKSSTGSTWASNYKAIPLDHLFEPELLSRMISEGYVLTRSHEDDPNLYVMCYSRTAQYDGKWNDCTKQARGLIVRSESQNFSDAIVVERPWRKFFTLEQHNDNWVLGDEENPESAIDNIAKLDFHAPAEVTNKADGSLGILYVHPDGRPALATKGSFGSDQADYYTNFLRNTSMIEEAEKLISNHPEKTFLFELVGPNNRIVLNYDEDKIIMLGAVEKSNGLYYSPNDYSAEWSDGVTETMDAETVTEALSLPDRPNSEGVVIRVISSDPNKQMQLKVKQDDYKMLHRLVSGFTVTDMRNSLKESTENVDELVKLYKNNKLNELSGVKAHLSIIEAHPILSDLKKQREETFVKVLAPRLKELSAANDFVNSLPESVFKGANPKKDFALKLNELKVQNKSDFFVLFEAKLNNRKLSDISGERILSALASSVKKQSLGTVDELDG